MIIKEFYHEIDGKKVKDESNYYHYTSIEKFHQIVNSFLRGKGLEGKYYPANTNTYGRSGFSIHGGLNKGSAGCIDIPWQTGKLDDYLDECQDSVPVKVKYPKDW